MKKVEIKPGGILPPSEKNYYGGTFSFWEKLRMNGVGSPKMIYDSGITEFDQADKGVGGVVSFVNMEVLKNGLIFRLNRNNQHRCVGLRLTDVTRIKLTAFRIERLIPGSEQDNSKIVHRGVLELSDVQQHQYRFDVMTSEFKDMLSFLQKAPFGHLFEYEVSEAAPEIESLRNWN